MAWSPRPHPRSSIPLSATLRVSIGQSSDQNGVIRTCREEQTQWGVLTIQAVRRERGRLRMRLVYNLAVDGRFDLDLLDEDPFQVEAQVAHLFKHPRLGLHDVYDVWAAIRCSTQPSRLRTG